jgi:hypothetical protein
MVRIFLDVVLALTLILNGISAPWAMARMAHAGHGSSATHVHESIELASAKAPARTDHHGHGHDMGSGETAQVPESPEGGSCCDGTSCQCGCVLPPALSVARADLIRHAVESTDGIVPLTRFVPHRDSPPLRPPAV